MYLTALQLLDLFPLKQLLPGCSDAVAILDFKIGGPQEQLLAQRMKLKLLEISNLSVLEKVIAGIKDVVANGEAWDVRYTKALQLITQAQADQPVPPTLDVLAHRKTAAVAIAQTALLAHPMISEAVGATGNSAANAFSLAISQITGQNVSTLEHEPIALPWLRAPFASSDDSPEGSPLFDVMSSVSGGSSFGSKPQKAFEPSFPADPFYHFCVPPNPIIEALRLHAELNLYKIRTCRNIAGMERQVEPYAAATDALSGLPYIGSGDQLVLPGTVTLQPTPYRYGVLIERAKQLAQMAAQFEGAMLATFEKHDAEAYQMLKARHDVELRRAGVRLQVLRVREVESGVELAELQQERAQIQVDYYDGLLDTGVSPLEAMYVGLLAESMFVPDSVEGGGASGKVSWSPSGKLQTAASIFSTLASWERRKQDWEFQKSLAQQDVRIGAQQVRIAKDQVRVVGQERKIAETEANHATQTRVFPGQQVHQRRALRLDERGAGAVYRFFLQQATAAAQLAEDQLAFERQEVPPAIIQADYWEAPAEGRRRRRDGQAPDRRGLTGSARLLQDILPARPVCLRHEQRKLQLTKTISLARLDPVRVRAFPRDGRAALRHARWSCSTATSRATTCAWSSACAPRSSPSSRRRTASAPHSRPLGSPAWSSAATPLPDVSCGARPSLLP